MSERSKHIDQLYKDQLGDYTELPPASVWESLERRLDKDNEKGGGFDNSGGNGRPRFPIRWWWALLGLLLLIGAAVGINQLLDRKEKIVAVNTLPKQTPANTTTASVAIQEASAKGNNNEVMHSPSGSNNSKEGKSATGSTAKVSSAKTSADALLAKESSTDDDNSTTKQKTNNNAPVSRPTTANTNTNEKVSPTASDKELQPATVKENVIEETERGNEEVSTTKTKNKESNTASEVSETEKQVVEEKDLVTTTTEVKTVATITKKEQSHTTNKELVSETVSEGQRKVVEKKTDKQEEIEAKNETEEVKVATPQKEVTETIIEEVVPPKEEEIITAKKINNTAEEQQVEVEKMATAIEEKKETAATTKVADDNINLEQKIEQTEAEIETEVKESELAFLSASPKEIKKQKRKNRRAEKKKQDKVEELEEDDLGINEFNTLTPTPPKPRKWEIGIKAGYQYGFNNSTKADKFVLSPYLQYMVVPHFSLVFQPSYLWGSAKVTLPQAAESFYDLRNTGVDSTISIFEGDTINFKPDTLVTTFVYSKLYDSTHVSYQLKQKQVWDIELPLMLQYDITPKLAIYGGVSFSFSKVLTLQQNRLDFAGLTIMDTVINRQVYPANQSPPPPPSPQDPTTYFSNSGTPISQYQPYTSSTQSTFTRIGFMLGVRATIAERYMIDVMYQQSAVDKTVITDTELQKVYSQPYLRLTLGYKLFK